MSGDSRGRGIGGPRPTNYSIDHTKGSAAKVLVDDISMVIKAGELLAIMVCFYYICLLHLT
jgi:hypothetical protein